MNISINCKLSLSKKLRNKLGKTGSVTLVSSPLVDGKGECVLSLSSDEDNDSKLDFTETSIMITPVEVVDSTPTSDSPSQATIFSTVPLRGKEEPVVSKIAAVHAPEKKELHKAIKANIETPQAFKEIDVPECKEWITNMADLIQAVNASKNKKSTIDLSQAQNDREKAILFDMKEKEEAIDVPAWIINDKSGHIIINDLGISLPLNSPYSLANLSARRIATSKDLQGLIKQGLVRFMTQREWAQFNGTEEEEEEERGLEVFSKHEDAEASIANLTDDEDDDEGAKSIRKTNDDLIRIEEVNENNAEKLTEEESMVINLTKGMSTVKTGVPQAERKTVHANRPPPKASSKAKPIRKLED